MRCTNCWRLGHPKSACNSNRAMCKICGEQEHGTSSCTSCCINCKSSQHDSNSNTCPRYLSIKEAIKLSVDTGITIKEAKLRLAASNLPSTHSPSNASRMTNSTVDVQISALQEEIKSLNNRLSKVESIIPPIQTELSLMREQSEANNAGLIGRFDGLEALIRKFLPPVYAHLPLTSHSPTAVSQGTDQQQDTDEMDTSSLMPRTRGKSISKDDQPLKKIKTATRTLPHAVK